MLSKINSLQSSKFNAHLITKKENIGYLTNFWGSSGNALVSPRSIKLFTDSRYTEEAKSTVFQNVKILDFKELKAYINNKVVGYEANHVTVAQLNFLKNKYPKVSFRKLKNGIEKSRIIKTDAEIKIIQKAAAINDRILEDIRGIIKIGIMEKELQWEIRKLAYSYGAEKMAFNTIVNFNINTALPHHEPNETKLKKGDLILIDMGVKFEKYCSDITRVFFTKKPTAKEKEVFYTLLEAQEKAIEQINKNNSCQNADKAAREHIKQAGYGEYFGHTLGHGVGLEIHESPTLSPLSKDKFTENNVFTIEPGIYIPNQFGIRLEDLFIYKQKKAMRLSKFTKEIEELILK